MSDVTDETLVPKSRDDSRGDSTEPAPELDEEKSTSEKLAARMMSVIEKQSTTQANQFTEQASQNKRMMILVGIALGVVALLLAGVVGVGIQLDFFGFKGSTTGTPMALGTEHHEDVEADAVPSDEPSEGGSSEEPRLSPGPVPVIGTDMHTMGHEIEPWDGDEYEEENEGFYEEYDSGW